jgi:hypothetical protein
VYVFLALASLRHAHLGSFSFDPEDIRKLSREVNCNFGKGTCSLNQVLDKGAQRSSFKTEVHRVWREYQSFKDPNAGGSDI